MDHHDTIAPHSETGVGGEGEVREAPYAFSGDFYEACDCFTICPCWTGSAPDADSCTGVFVWSIQKGEIEGVDVAGRRVASVSTHTGHREMAQQRVLVFVDEGASEEQATRLAQALTGQLGGPLRELAKIMGELLAVETAAIELEHEGRHTKLSVGRKIVVSGAGATRRDGRATTLADARLSDVLGSPAEVGVTHRFKVGLPGHGIDVDLRGRSSMRGPFSYEHRPVAGG
jgi:hypothetical protein